MGDLRGMAGVLRSVRLQSVIAAIACLALLLACAGQSQAQGWQTARTPLGVYAHVDIESAVKDYISQTNQATPGPCFALSQAETGSEPSEYTNAHDYLHDLYTALLSNPAVAGIAVGVHWCLIQVASPDCGSDICGGYPKGNDWSWLDDLFKVALAKNKNVQLHIVPGVDSPSWLFNLDTNPSCDPVINAATPNSDYQNCGWVTFSKLPESLQNPDSMMLPLPWKSPSNSVYFTYWNTFLAELNERYGRNPVFAPAFASIDVAGPVSVSSEMILPTTANKSAFLTELDVDTGWECLIETSFPGSGNNCSQIWSTVAWDQAFINAWTQTIVAYESIFSGVTLALTPDNGKDTPEIGTLPPSGDTAETSLWNTDCSVDMSTSIAVSCEAKAAVVSAFVAASGPNEKSTTDGGFTASSSQTTGDIGLPGGEVLAGTPMPPQSPPFLAGAQFDHAVTANGKDSHGTPLIEVEGCLPNPPGCPNPPSSLTPEGATYNVLANFFSGTVAAGIYNESPPLTAYPLHFLIMEYKDICYAATNTCPPSSCGAAVCTSMQNLIATASSNLFATAGKSPLTGSPLSTSSACTAPLPPCPCPASASSCP